MHHLKETIELLLLIAVGFGFKLSYGDNTTANALKSLITKLFLPVLIFTAFTSISPHMHFSLYPIFAVIYSFFLFFFFKLFISRFDKTPTEITQTLMLSTLAPGLSVYPFVITFMTRADLANASLLDFGEKLFIFIFIYFACYFILGRKANLPVDKNLSTGQQVKSVVKNILTEPVNIAILLGVVLLFLEIEVVEVAPTAAKILIDIGNTTVILVMLFIGLSLKKYDIYSGVQGLLLLLMRSGLGFLFTAGFCYAVGIRDHNTVLLFASFTQGSVSFWPYVTMLYLNKLYKTDFYQDEVALQLLAFSFPLTIAIMITLFNLRNPLTELPTMTIIGAALTIVTTIAYYLINNARLKSASAS